MTRRVAMALSLYFSSLLARYIYIYEYIYIFFFYTYIYMYLVSPPPIRKNTNAKFSFPPGHAPVLKTLASAVKIDFSR